MAGRGRVSCSFRFLCFGLSGRLVFGADNAGIGSARTSSRRSPGLIPSHPELCDHNRCRGEPPMHGVVSATKDHAPVWRRGQAKTGLTATHPGEELRMI